MGQLIPNTFSKYQLNADEEKVAETFNHLQIQGFHNMRTEIAESKLMLKVDPSDPGGAQQFFLDQAFKDGCIAILTRLIDFQQSQDITTTEV